ncbi:MAG: Holliday junction resolvase RuvX [Gammaproteobacteria bacterium]|nr:Holliday junction resolvase RuvX [Gammaproteobacteria bacterium]
MRNQNGCFLGFDFGTKRIGVAVGQRITQTASPLTTVFYDRGEPDFLKIQKLIQEWRPEALIVGIPFNMDDTESASTQAARRFVAALESRFQLPVHPIDERLTTRAVRYELKEQGKDQLQKVDAYAACLILESFLRG